MRPLKSSVWALSKATLASISNHRIKVDWEDGTFATTYHNYGTSDQFGLRRQTARPRLKSNVKPSCQVKPVISLKSNELGKIVIATVKAKKAKAETKAHLKHNHAAEERQQDLPSSGLKK